MSRTLHANTETELEQAQTAPRYLVKIEFDSGDLRLWDGLGEITYNSEVYTGAGRLAGVRAMKETQQTVATGVELSLLVIPTSDVPDAVDSVLTIAHSEEYQGRPVTIWQAQIDDAGALISNPFIRFKGQLDQMREAEIPAAALITVTAENRLIELEYASRRTYTPEDHRADHPNDSFFDGVAALQSREIRLE